MDNSIDIKALRMLRNKFFALCKERENLIAQRDKSEKVLHEARKRLDEIYQETGSMHGEASQIVFKRK